jgi:preprotein translocase subunit YajC
MLITPAFAQTASPGGGGDFIVQLVPFILIFVIMYFLIIRPQQRRVKEHREMISAIRRGDVVVTAGGLIGKVVRVVSDGEVKIEIADGVQVRAVKSTLAEVRARSEPVRERARHEPEGDDEDDGGESRSGETPDNRRPAGIAQAAIQFARKFGPAPQRADAPPSAEGRKSAAKGQQGRTRPKNKGQNFTAEPHPPAGVMTDEEALDEAALNAAAQEVEHRAEADVRSVEREMKSRNKDKRGS